MKSGGITKLKQHLVGGYSNIVKCKSCPFILSAQMRKLLKGTKAKKSDKKRKNIQQDSLQ